MNSALSLATPRALLALAALGVGGRAQDLLVQAATLVAAPDAIVTPGELLVRDGKVAYVGQEIPPEARAAAPKQVFAGATIVPGFVLAHATLRRDQDLAERAVAMTPALLAADAFDPFQDELLALPRCGVTAMALSPASTNVAAGLAAFVKPGERQGTLVRDRCYAKFSLGAAARQPERQPTALMGAIDGLRTALREARDGQRGGTDLAVYGSVLRGELRAFVQADTRAEILAVLALAREFGFEPVLVGATEAATLLDAIAAARAALVLPPLHPGMRDEQLQLPAQLEARGVPFCLGGEGRQLRASAALAVQHGCSRKAALQALTRTPAELCGQGASHGALRRGCDADFVVFDGDPLDLSTRLLAVFLAGHRLDAARVGAKTATKQDQESQ